MAVETLGYRLPWYFALAMWVGWLAFIAVIVVIGRRRMRRKRAAPQMGRSNARLKGLPPGDR